MQFINWQGRQLSRMMLGTVQFGMPYGVANRTGQPDARTVARIIAAALEGGVNCFDTAAAYGTSEEVLGRALRELGTAEQVTVVTKVQPLTDEAIAAAGSAEQAITNSVDRSRTRLEMDCLPLVLFHQEQDARYLDVLESLRARGWLECLGVSCDNFPEGAVRLVDEPLVSALQVPANLVDHRHQQSGLFESAVRNQVAVFVRSVFLQGLLTMPEQSIPAALLEIVPVRRQLQALAEQAGCSLTALCVRYLLSVTGISCLLTGVETLEQVHENVQLFTQGPLESDLSAEIQHASQALSELVITPRLWKQATK